ncbi:organic cation transporter protein-like [Battus philenor]|uniref:organic cation transporter protein-like n=1 Tax=Battus philenor TaxID=42288 RepID=UPI0035CFEADB
MSSEKVESQPVKSVDLDSILIEEAGQFGRSQIITILLASIPVIFAAFASGEYVFTTARIPTRCSIPQCDDPNPEFRPSWILNAIPGTSNTDFDNCLRYANSSVISDARNICPAYWFDRNRTEECQSYIYENTNSVVYDFDLACNEWKRSLIGSIRTVGTLLVLPFTGYISDRWGRRVALAINAFNTAWLGLVRSFVHSYEWFTALEIIEATLGAGGFSCCYILVTELVGPKYRVRAGVTMSTMYAVGLVILGFISWGIQPWRTLTQVLYAPQLLTLSYFWIMTESVRWLLSKGKYEEAEAVLKKVAKTNKREISPTSMENLRAATQEKELNENAKEPWLLITILKSRVMLSRVLVSPIWWVTNTLIYFGMSINAVNLSGNPYLNYIAVAAVEIPGFWTAILLLDRIGRKPVLIGGYWICAACQFTFAFLPEGNENLSLALYLIGKYCISMVTTSTYIYTTEIYPTKYRHSLLAFSSMIGRLGSILAPLTPALALEVWESLPSVLFGSFAILSGLLIFTTPETLGITLPDTIEEAERLSSRSLNSRVIL